MSEKPRKPQFEPVIEDTVQCLFFFTSLSQTDLSSWEQRCSDINRFIQKFSEEYIWHRDEFKLFLPIDENKNKSIPTHLASSTCFGDNVEDEWFIVYIVLELTKHYNDLIVQMRDNDGEFLLIEAANILPSWANPENTDNRVFISNNHINIIEPNVISIEENIDLKDALSIVSNKQAYVSSDIDQAIISRIGNYPEKNQNNIHKAVVNLPIHIATLLALKPSLIAPIVSAYCNCDVIDAKACKNITFGNCVTVEVKFTKFLYAMLMHSKLLSCTNKYNFISEKDKCNIIGLKLTCGFQMIMNSSSDIFSTKEYNKFLNSLKDNGYFKDNIEGSKEYKLLLERAQSFFSNVECPMNLHVCNEISKLMETIEYKNIMKTIKLQNSTGVQFSAENDDWLTVQPDQLNDFLEDNYGKRKFKSSDNITPELITSELTRFLTKSSDFEGIERNDDEEDTKHINFDPDDFTNCLEKIMNLLVTKTDDSDLDSDISDVDEIDEYQQSCNTNDNEMDDELKMKLHSYKEDDLFSNAAIANNLQQSIKEEHASAGPSSNLLNAIGIHKQDVLDSDDDNN